MQIFGNRLQSAIENLRFLEHTNRLVLEVQDQSVGYVLLLSYRAD